MTRLVASIFVAVLTLVVAVDGASAQCGNEELANAVARVLEECGCPGPRESLVVRKAFAACRGGLLRQMVGEGSLSESCEDALYQETQHCIGDDGPPPGPRCGEQAEDADAVAATLTRIGESCDCRDPAKLFLACRKQVILAATAGKAPVLSEACAQALEAQEPPPCGVDVPAPGSTCEDVQSCEGQLAAVLPPTSGVPRDARRTARRLSRVGGKALRTLEKAARGTGARQQRRYDKASRLLDKLLDAARTADAAGTLWMPLSLIEDAAANLLALIPEPQ